ncbi:MAG: DNA polymerase III subunit gamma/tau [Pelagibacteraceae bacterium TMED232]|nr:MAG: DNA polymerase III subunit gamma/tau [Pelagibacteraceae bacterium TMED232]|tara:strand:+ start:98 stop:1771 length:1674 start_codon:yes stop_codon:yes gene_type:complete
MNNNSKVLALKYRPQTFKDLIGQNTIAETIINSIKIDKAPNAYLFTGIRGVGKTTLARIVAKALNCKNSFEKISEQDLCESCDCKAIANSNHIDVLEMDAASKTGVDDVRDLIEFSRYGPTSAKYKIFIIDEVHMLSKQAFNALLKTLEEPPSYLKFIFATTEIKKIPITVVSRCQRFDLSRIKSTELFDFLKKISLKENGNVSDEALKLIVKISEGSVRDALSLLDRGLVSVKENEELTLSKAQKIFGFFDKAQLIDLFTVILEGNESKTLELYRKMYDRGMDPKVFINDFLELLYYLKNIDSLKLEGSSFFLNDTEYDEIKRISGNLDNKTLILFWQFTIKIMNELDIVSNQNLSIEMFLLRLIYLGGIKENQSFENNFKDNDLTLTDNSSKDIKENFSKSNNTINQIKNISQTTKIEPKKELKTFSECLKKVKINSFSSLIKICNDKKEVKLKYELENNVNLVKFENLRIEISFNEKLDKSFIKDLTSKLNDWTGERWIITLSKIAGEISYKEKLINYKKEEIEKINKSKLFLELKKNFNDIKLVDVKNKDEEE